MWRVTARSTGREGQDFAGPALTFRQPGSGKLSSCRRLWWESARRSHPGRRTDPQHRTSAPSYAKRVKRKLTATGRAKPTATGEGFSGGGRPQRPAGADIATIERNGLLPGGCAAAPRGADFDLGKRTVFPEGGLLHPCRLLHPEERACGEPREGYPLKGPAAATCGGGHDGDLGKGLFSGTAACGSRSGGHREDAAEGLFSGSASCCTLWGMR